MLHTVDRFWLPLEQDFADKGIRAMDWFEHKRDWREFYRLKQAFGVGSHTHAAMSMDPEIAEQAAEWARKNRNKKGGVEIPLQGFDRYMHKLTDLQDTLTALISVQGGGDFRPAPRPVPLAQKLASEKSRARARSRAMQLVPNDFVEESD